MPHSCDESPYTAARASQSGKANGFTDCTCDLSMLILLLLPLLPDRRNEGLCNNNILRKSCPTASTSGQVDPISLLAVFLTANNLNEKRRIKKIGFIYLLPERNTWLRSLFMLTVRYGSNTLNPDSILVMKITLPTVTQLNH